MIEHVKLDLLRKYAIWGTFDTHMAKLFDIDATAITL